MNLIIIIIVMGILLFLFSRFCAWVFNKEDKKIDKENTNCKM